MANYDAQINILVAGQRNIENLANQLNAIEDSIDQIQRRWRTASAALQRSRVRLGVTGTEQPRGPGGRFARDPDRQARFAAFADQRRAAVEQRITRLALSRTRAEAERSRSLIDDGERLLRQTERRISLESRLNSANELYQRRVQQLARGGGGANLPQNLQQQARSIQSAYQAAGGFTSRNLGLIRDLGNELGKIVERQNEFNRLQSLSSKGFEAGRRLQERIGAAAQRADLPARQVQRARLAATEAIAASRSGDQQRYSEAIRRATAATSRLERQSRELAAALSDQEREARRIASIAPRSPIRGGVNFPGSPIFNERLLRESQRGYASSPIRGGVNIPGSPIFRETPLLERRLGKRGSAAISEGLIGGAFPLLFGQGLGASILGGAGGAAGAFMGGGLGFGLSLVGTALGTAFDTFNNNLKELASNLKDPTSSLEAMKTAGLRVTPELEYLVQKLDSSGRAVEAQQRVFEELERQLGAGMVDQLRALNSEQKELDRQWQELSATLVTSLLPAITGTVAIVNDVIGGFKSLGSVKLPPWLSKSLGLATEAQMGIASVAAPGFGISRFFLQNALNRGRQEAKAQAGKGESLTPQKQEEALRGQIQAAQEIRSLRQQGADIERSSAELRLGIEDTIYGFRRRAEDMAREGIQFRRSMENEIFSKRQDLDRQIIENDRRRQQNAIDAFDLQLQRASIGIDPIARGVVDAGRDYFRIVAEALADKEQSEKQLALDIAKINRDADQYSLEIEDRIYQMTRQREEFSRDVSRAKTQAEYQIQDYIIKVEQYRVEMAQKRVDLALQEADGIAKATQIAAGTGLFDGTPGNVVGGAAGLQQAIERIRGAYSFRGTSLAKNKRPGDYQSDPRENFFFDFQSRSVIDAAKKRVSNLTDKDIAALALTVLTEAGPTNVGKMDVAANLITRSAMKGGVPISAIATAPGQYEGVFKRGLRPGQLEDPAFGRRMFGVAYDRVFSMFSGRGASASGAGGSWFSIPAGFPGAQAPVDKYGLTVGAQAAPTSQSASAAPGIGTFVGGGRASIASAQSMARDMSMPIPPSPPSLPQWPSAPALIKVNDLQEKNNELARESVKIRQAGSEAERESIRNKIEEAQLAVTAKARAPIDAIREQTQSLLDDIELRKLRNRLLIEGVSPVIVEGEVRIAEITRTSNRLIAEQDKLLASLLGVQYDGTNAIYEMALARLKELQVMQPGNVELEKERLNLEGILKARQGILEATGGAVAGAADVAAMEALPGQQIQGFIAEATAELYNLESVAISVSQGIGNAVGSSIANGISGLVQGTTTAKEVFANFLTDVGQLLVQEGTKMIATYVAIGIAKMFAGLGGASNAFGPGGAPNFSGAFGATGPSFNPGAFSMGPLAADGAYFSNGIAAFAMGGAFANSIVSSPTLFQFADGGALKAGVMGEAGPEAIMPLERGPDGRLGVRASLSVPFEGGSVMPEEGLDSESGQSDTTRMRRLAAAASSSLRIPFSSANGTGADVVGAGFAGAVSSAAVDSSTSPVETLIRFESTVINGVEFVTRQEAEQIGRTAAARGADLAQRRLKNNPQVRRSIGI